MRRLPLRLSALAAATLAVAAAAADATDGAPIGSAAELAAFLGGGAPGARDFSVTGRVEFATEDTAVVADGAARVLLVSSLVAPPPRGAIVRAAGLALVPKENAAVPFPLRGEPLARADGFEVLSADAPPPPPRVPLAAIDPARDDLSLLETAGTVSDAVDDDLDARYAVLTLADGGRTLPVFVPRRPGFDAGALVGARVEAAGLFWKSLSSVRKFTGPVLSARSADDVRVAAPAPDPFAAPELESLRYASPAAVSALGRRTVRGRLVAAWGRGELLVRTADGRLVRAELSGGAAAPPTGAWVAISGLPRTDLIQIRLVLASVREEPGPAPGGPDGAAPDPVPLSDVARREDGRVAYHAQFDGCPVLFEGRVVGPPAAGGAPGTFLVDADGLLATVDASSAPGAAPDGLAEGTVVRVSGVCVLESSPWSPENAFPRVEGFRVVVVAPDGVRVLRRPPWWTPGRLAAAAAALLAALAAVLVWNRALDRLAARRGRELLAARLDRERATLRVAERTRLAAELHDSLSQCLGGLAFQLVAAKSLAAAAAPDAARCLDAAEGMLQSSRTELQRCLFDLRGSALDEPDFAKAVSAAVAPIAGDAEVQVRLAGVRRDRMSDTVAHAAICIARELVSNALRHGGARHVAVEGGERGGALAFSVRDDGRGFDTARRPGPSEGHFGLEGVRERVRRLGGALRIESAPGAGAMASVELPLAEKEGEETA